MTAIVPLFCPPVNAVFFADEPTRPGRKATASCPSRCCSGRVGDDEDGQHRVLRRERQKRGSGRDMRAIVKPKTRADERVETCFGFRSRVHGSRASGG
jgi:hypothetical protein